MILTNREMFGYFREANVVKTHNLNPIIANRCLNIDFILKLEAGEAEECCDMSGKDLGRMCEFLNTESLGKQFWQADVYDNTKVNFPNPGKGSPGSISKDNDIIANVHNWSRFAKQEMGRCSKGNVRNANVTNGEETTRVDEEGLEKEEYCEYHEDWGGRWMFILQVTKMSLQSI